MSDSINLAEMLQRTQEANNNLNTAAGSVLVDADKTSAAYTGIADLQTRDAQLTKEATITSEGAVAAAQANARSLIAAMNADPDNKNSIQYQLAARLAKSSQAELDAADRVIAERHDIGTSLLHIFGVPTQAELDQTNASADSTSARKQLDAFNTTVKDTFISQTAIANTITTATVAADAQVKSDAYLIHAKDASVLAIAANTAAVKTISTMSEEQLANTQGAFQDVLAQKRMDLETYRMSIDKKNLKLQEENDSNVLKYVNIGRAAAGLPAFNTAQDLKMWEATGTKQKEQIAKQFEIGAGSVYNQATVNATGVPSTPAYGDSFGESTVNFLTAGGATTANNAPAVKYMKNQVEIVRAALAASGKTKVTNDEVIAELNKQNTKNTLVWRNNIEAEGSPLGLSSTGLGTILTARPQITKNPAFAGVFGTFVNSHNDSPTAQQVMDSAATYLTANPSMLERTILTLREVYNTSNALNRNALGTGAMKIGEAGIGYPVKLRDGSGVLSNNGMHTYDFTAPESMRALLVRTVLKPAELRTLQRAHDAAEAAGTHAFDDAITGTIKTAPSTIANTQIDYNLPGSSKRSYEK
jgi:hypothetical protein